MRRLLTRRPGSTAATILVLMAVFLVCGASASASKARFGDRMGVAAEGRAVAGIGAARTALRLTGERLALMKQVMASKWVSRSPIQDRAQERVVMAGALALSRRRGLADAGVRRVFGQEILAAKEVQLGWGQQWLWYGFPRHLRPPDLTQMRAKLASLTPEVVDALARLGRLRCQARGRVALLHASRRLIRTRFVSDRRRAAIVAALLSVRRVGSSCP